MEDIANVIKISVHERKLHRSNVSLSSRYPLKSTLHLDQFFDRDEMTCIALLNLAVFNHVCKSEEEYCFMCIMPRPLRYPTQQRDGGQDGGKGNKLSAQEMDKLEDVVYRYGGESMILRTKEDTPVEVLRAYKMLNKIHGSSKQCLRAVFVHEQQKTISQIKKHCFQFMQNVLTNNPMWIPLTRQCVGGKFIRCKGGYVSTSIAPPGLESSSGYNTRWGSLTKKVVLLLRKYDKTMAKALDCECKLDSPLLFEFSLTCTILEKSSATTFSMLNNWYIDVRRDDGYPKEDIESSPLDQPALISWQCYDSCYGGNRFLEVLEKDSELIRMLCDEDEHDHIHAENKLQLHLLIRRVGHNEHVHTFTHVDRDIVLDGMIIFCYRGLPPEDESMCTCSPHVLHQATFFKSLDDEMLPKNSLILGSWPFPRDPFDQVPTNMTLAKGDTVHQQ